MGTEIHFRPLDNATWIDGERDSHIRCPFKATYAKTLSQLRYELGKLRVRDAVIEIDFAGDDLRLDGMPYAHAKPRSPRVRLSFDAPDIGSQCFMCDTYAHWHENLRGIVMTLDRLRAIERYGATRGQQQYRGWSALPETTDAPFATREAAWDYLKACAGPLPDGWEGTSADLYRIAARRNHPDKGGDPAKMARINAARAVAV